MDPLTKAELQPSTPDAAFAEAEPRLPGAGTWYAPLRREALARFRDVGFPTTRHEEWRHTDVRPVARMPFRPVLKPGPADRALVARWSLAAQGAHELVFVDGRLAPELSAAQPLPGGARVRSLAEALAADADALRGLLGRAPVDGQPFTALNAAFAADGAVVEIPRGVALERPLHLLFVTTGRGDGTVTSPRNVIVVGEAAQATVVETYAGAADAVYLTNTVTEVVAGEGANLDHVRVQVESEKAFHVGLVHSSQGRASVVASRNVSLGSALGRNGATGVLGGEGCELELDGLYLAHGEQHLTNYMRVDHAKPHGSSRQLYKGVLDGRSRGVFDGKIIVRPDAQKTDAKQTNRNLLLSDESLVDSNPQLEIFADDVKCTHGSTTGQLDEAAVFYLQSRGVDEFMARSLLTYAFATEVTQRIRFAPLRERLEDLVIERLPDGSAVREVFA